MGRLLGGERRRDALCLGALFLIAALFLWPAWRQPDGFWYAPGASYSDLAVTHWPTMWFVAQTLREQGQVPLWRPLIMGGAPFVGNPLAALFYPPNWLFALLPVTPTLHLLIGLHLFLSGATLYGLVRWSYRCSAYAALCAGIGYMLTPKLVAHLGAGHIGLSQAFAWLPLTHRGHLQGVRDQGHGEISRGGRRHGQADPVHGHRPLLRNVAAQTVRHADAEHGRARPQPLPRAGSLPHAENLSCIAGADYVL